jgi:hypothetical protein
LPGFVSLETEAPRNDTIAQGARRAMAVSWRSTAMSKAHFTTAVVALVALLSAGVLATSPIDEALMAAGAADASSSVDANLPHPTKGIPQWNS